jgi:hypothetical protein
LDHHSCVTLDAGGQQRRVRCRRIQRQRRRRPRRWGRPIDGAFFPIAIFGSARLTALASQQPKPWQSRGQSPLGESRKPALDQPAFNQPALFATFNQPALFATFNQPAVDWQTLDQSTERRTQAVEPSIATVFPAVDPTLDPANFSELGRRL